MKKRDSQKKKALAFVLVLVLSVVPAAFAETAQSWDAAPSSVGGGMDLTVGGTAVTVSFPEKTQANAMPTVCDLLVGGSDPSSSFSGDISGYTGIRFKITGDGHQPGGVQLVLYKDVGDGTIREWTFDAVAVSTNAGEWTVNLVPLNISKGWSSAYNFDRYRPGKDTAEYWWPQDLQDIDMLIVRIASSGLDAQSYSIDQFQLLGADGPTEPAQLTPLMEYFGVNSIDELTELQKKQDSDGDGMSDLNEILAGMDPQDASSVFRAVSQKFGNGNKIKWQGVLGAKYAVLRSSDLTSGFELIANEVTATYTGLIEFEDPNPVAGKANFYKVVKY